MLLTKLPHCNDLSRTQCFRIACIHYDFFVVQGIILFDEVPLVDSFFFQETCIAWILNIHFLHHLVNDSLKVLIVDFHPLQAVNLLDTVDNIFLYSSWSFDRQNIPRRNLSVRQRHTCFDKVIVLNKDVLRKWNQVFLHLTVTWLDRNLTI